MNRILILALVLASIAVAYLGGYNSGRRSVPSESTSAQEANSVTTTNVVNLVVYQTNVVNVLNPKATQHGENLAARDYRAGGSAEGHIEHIRPEYTEFLGRIGATGEAIERVLTEMTSITRLAYMAEASTADLMRQQRAFTNLLGQIMTPEQAAQFIEHERQRPIEKEFRQLATFASEKSLNPLSDAGAAALQRVITEQRTFTGGAPILGPLDPAPVPSIGTEAVLLRDANERASLLAMRDLAVKTVTEFGTPEDGRLVADYYARSLNAKDEITNWFKKANDPAEVAKLQNETREQRRARLDALREEAERRNLERK